MEELYERKEVVHVWISDHDPIAYAWYSNFLNHGPAFMYVNSLKSILCDDSFKLGVF